MVALPFVAALATVMSQATPPKPAASKPTPAVTPAPADVASGVRLELVTADSTDPVGLVAAPEPKGRLFVVEKRGKIRVWKGGRFLPTPFLDLSGQVALDDYPNGEQGLLGLAFHPQFAAAGKPGRGRAYVNYTDLRGDTRVVEYRADPRNPDRLDPGSARLVLQADQPYKNHNAGHLAFGPDGKLYVALGDGGSADDPKGLAQHDAMLLGKLLRVDVLAQAPLVEVIGKGLRNPWRYAFDRKTNDLYIADVGQNTWEYVHVVPAAEVGAKQNFGWNVTEGLHCFKDKACDRKPFWQPVAEYHHSEGCSITGGFVYRGKALPKLDGAYFYADFCTALLRSFRWQDGRVSDSWDWKAALDPESKLARLSAFGEDQDGELYLISHDGPIYKLVPSK